MTTGQETTLGGRATLGEIARVLQSAPKQTFFICLGAYVLSQLDVALFAYAIPSIRKELDISLSVMGLVTGLSHILAAAILIGFARLTDRFGRKRMLAIGTAAAPIVISLTALCWSAWSLGIMRGLGFAATGISYPATGALVTETAPARVRGIFAGLLQTGYPIGWFAAAMLAAPLLTHFNWRFLFLITLLWVPYTWVIVRFLKEPARFEAAQKSGATGVTFRQALRELLAPGNRRRLAILFLAQFMFVVAYGGTQVFFPTYFVEERHLQISSSAYLVGIGNAVAVLGYILAAVTGEAFLTRRTTVVIWTLLGSAMLMVLIWGTATYTETIVAFAVMSMFFTGTAAVKFAYIAEVFPTHLRATGLTVCGVLAVSLGQSLGPILMAEGVKHLGWNMALSLVGAIPLMVAGLFYLFLKPIPSGLEVEEAARQA